MEEGEDVGDGRAEELSAIGDGQPALTSLMPDVDGLHIRSFESSQLEGSCVGYLLCILILNINHNTAKRICNILANIFWKKKCNTASSFFI